MSGSSSSGRALHGSTATTTLSRRCESDLGGVDPVTEEDERRQLRAEIDAAAFHAYGLGPEEMQFVLDDFHLVDNPRLMDCKYLEMVSEQYHELA